MAGKKLAANVWVNGEFHEAGSTPPKEVADQIANPKAWNAPEDETEQPIGDSDPKALNKAVKKAASEES